MPKPEIFVTSPTKVFNHGEKPAWRYRAQTANGSFFVAENGGSGRFTFFDLWVSHADGRRNGLGSRLVCVMTRLALEKRAVEARGFVTSQFKLKIFGRLFGEDRILFSENAANLPMTIGQATASLIGAKGYEEDLNHRDNGILTTISLVGLVKANFEKPIFVQ